MSTAAIVAIVVIAAVVILAIIAFAAWRAKRRAELRSRFGPEYDRTVESASSRRAAERDLRDRAARREELQIVPLDPVAAERYRTEWRLVQERFVDEPAPSVAQAHDIVTRVMSDRGYPTRDGDERASMLSVDHADLMDRYRTGMRTEQQWRSRGSADTEELRQAMQHYRAVFARLVDDTDADVAPDAYPTGTTTGTTTATGTAPVTGAAAEPDGGRIRRR